MRTICIIIISIFFGLNSPITGAIRDTLDISGIWKYQLLGAPVSIPGEGNILLPGTLDNSHKSIYNPESDNTSQLRKEFSFVGNASYSRKIEIPKDWKGRNIELFLERTKPSKVSIDGKIVGTNSRISSPQRYNLSDYLSPGIHTIEISVNNADSIPPIVARSSNAVSESTQTNWNGILGEISLIAKDSFHIKRILIDEKSYKDHVLLTLDFSQRSPSVYNLRVLADGKELSHKEIRTGSSSIRLSLPINLFKLWSATNPNLQELSFIIQDMNGKELDSYDIVTGFRDFSADGKQFVINNQPVFLRGTVNAAVFPITAYAPVDEESWINYFSILKEYGFNHVRFHSWTPPDAAFNAADKTGFYIMAELPIWGELDRDLSFHNRFLKEEMKGIMEAYSHHPSFVMFSTGNELWGDISLMGEYMKYARTKNPRILSTYGTNVYLGMNGEIGEEDFIVSSKTNDKIENSIRGSDSFADSPTGGHFNTNYPNSDFNFSSITETFTVPLISHEVGQYQSYPNFEEIEKYTGILKPDNLIEFKKRAIEAGTYRKNIDYNYASGKWATKLYKAEMELALRSNGIGGFELFGLQDYPGQGTALVGILDPFMDSKGFITPEEWKQSSSDIAILAEFPKFSFLEEESVRIPLVGINYTDNPDTISSIYWKTEFANGIIDVNASTGIGEIEPITLKIPKLSGPQKMTLSLSTNDSIVTNTYNFWVYPVNVPKTKDITVTNNLTEALILLEQGEKVILCPDSNTVEKASVDPLFVNDFWNYRMFRTICDEMNLKPSPGTLGLLINNEHPALKKFPTDIHTDWQWFPIIANSRPLIIDRLPKDFDPIIEVIDNVERNFRLSLMLECNVGKGKLIILSADMEKASQYPEGKWLLQSVKEYMTGKDFKPVVTLTPDQLVNLVTKPSNARLIRELKNETYNSHWE